MTRIVLIVFSLTYTLLLQGQEHPLSKSDSGIVVKSLAKYERLKGENDLRGASSALNDIAFVYWNNNHYSQAASYYELSLTFNKRVGNENGVAMINNNLGMLYSDLGQYEKSLEKFTETLAARRSADEPEGIVSALINLAVVQNNLKRYNKSIEYLTEALDIAREKYDRERMRSVYGMLSETYEKMGNIEKSLQYFELYKTFHEDLQRQEIKEVKRELQDEKLQKQLLAAEKAQQENELLKQQLEIYQKETELLAKDSINESLYSSLSRIEMQRNLLERDKQLSELETAANLAENQKLQQQKTNLRVVLILVVIAGTVIFGLILVNVRRRRKHTQALAEKNTSIERQRQELELANHTKDRIFSVISHDLRSPITSLQGFFMAIDEFDLPNDLKMALGNVESQLTNSATLLDNLLVWSRSQLENEQPTIERFNLSMLVDEILRLLQEPANAKNIKLINDLNTNDSLVSDQQMVSIVLRNLLQNAIKFTPRGGEVRVGLTESEKDACIKVSDTGVGMGEEKIHSLFDITTNRTSNGTENEKGSGLGLIICKELIEKVGGLIEVDSKPGSGTEFSLRFSRN